MLYYNSINETTIRDWTKEMTQKLEDEIEKLKAVAFQHNDREISYAEKQELNSFVDIAVFDIQTIIDCINSIPDYAKCDEF